MFGQKRTKILYEREFKISSSYENLVRLLQMFLAKLPEELKTWKIHFDWKLSVKRNFS
jgi:hypothetical protein